MRVTDEYARAIDDRVQQWHEAPPGEHPMPLQQWLGMTTIEYDLWLWCRYCPLLSTMPSEPA